MRSVTRRPARRALNLILLLAGVAWVPWVLAWRVDVEALTWLVPSAVAFLPYAAAFTLLVLVVSVAVRAPGAIAAALLGLVLLTVPRLGRVTSDPQPRADGPRFTVATANLLVGRSDPAWLAREAVRARVDVLAVQENTVAWDERAQASPLAAQFPHVLSVPDREGRASGLALWSRWPLRRVPSPEGDSRTLGALVAVPGAAPVQVRSAHPFPPFNMHNLRCWRVCTRALIGVRSGPASGGARDAILAGDWNATLDHHPLRDLLASGFRDAAEERGLAWRPTWSNGSWQGLSLDHVLVSERVAVLKVRAHDQPGSDHDVVVATLRLPR